jgi:hypothetical protein
MKQERTMRVAAAVGLALVIWTAFYCGPHKPEESNDDQ